MMPQFYSFRQALLLFCVFLLSVSGVVMAQVGIGTEPHDPNPAAALEIGFTDKGLLLPRVELENTLSFQPLGNNHIPGMVVYNTASAGNGDNEVTPGYYYSDGNTWRRLRSVADLGNTWSVKGNSETDAEQNFLGTKGISNNHQIRIGTNNNDIRMRFYNTGKIAVNRTNAGAMLHVDALNNNAIAGFTEEGNAIYGYSVKSVGIEGELRQDILQNSTGNPVRAKTNSGIGVWGESGEAGTGVYGKAKGANILLIFRGDGYPIDGRIDGIGTGVYGVVNHKNALGGEFINNNNSNIGLYGRAVSSDNKYGISGTGILGKANKMGVYAVATESDATHDNKDNSAGYFILGNSNVRAQARIAGFNIGIVEGSGSGGGPSGPQGNSDSFNYNGGYFEGGAINESYAFVGISLDTDINGEGGTAYKIIGNGVVSTLVNDAEGNKRTLFATEAPEILFKDSGKGKLDNGEVFISIDPLFASVIHVSDKYPLRVFIQMEDESNPVYVTEKTIKGFKVKEMNNGRSNASFTYQIVANRTDSKTIDGKITSKHIGLRFPYGPQKLIEKNTNKLELTEVKNESVVDEKYDEVKTRLLQINQKLLIGE